MLVAKQRAAFVQCLPPTCWLQSWACRPEAEIAPTAAVATFGERVILAFLQQMRGRRAWLRQAWGLRRDRAGRRSPDILNQPQSLFFAPAANAVKAAGISVMGGGTYEQEFAAEMARAKEGKAKSTPWGSGYGRAPEILHGARATGVPCDWVCHATGCAMHGVAGWSARPTLGGSG